MSQSLSQDQTEETQEQEVLETSAETKSDDEIIETLLSTASVKIQNLIPMGPIKSAIAVKVAKWILINSSRTTSLQRLKWLTGIVQYGIIDSTAELQKLFTPFIQLIFIREFQSTVCHLLYLIATPNLYKWQVDRICYSEQLVGLTKPLCGLLSRLKSLRPDLVPQTIPHQSSAASFSKLPPAFRTALYTLSEQIREAGEQPTVSTVAQVAIEQRRVTKKMRLDIIPPVEHVNLKSSFEVDFRQLVLVSQFDSFDALVPKMGTVMLPNHIGSLLSRRDYHHVLSSHFTPQVEVALSQWLYLTLGHEFLEKPQLAGREGKELLLDMIIEFQQTTGRKLMVVYDFLADYFRKWDGVQFADRVWQLLADAPFLPYADLYDNFLRYVERLFLSWDTPNRLRIIQCCSQLIHNLMLQKFGTAGMARRLFDGTADVAASDRVNVVEGTYVVSEVIRFTERLLNMGLTSSSSELSLIYAALSFYSRLIDLESSYGLPFRTFCQPIAVYSALFSLAPVCITMLCEILCKYRTKGTDELLATDVAKDLEEFRLDAMQNASMLSRYVADVSNCLVYRRAFEPHSESLLDKIPRRNSRMLRSLGQASDSFDLTRHPAFLGAAHSWWAAKTDKIRAKNVYEAITQDSIDYVQFLLTTFPAISAYINRFHK